MITESDIVCAYDSQLDKYLCMAAESYYFNWRDDFKESDSSDGYNLIRFHVDFNRPEIVYMVNIMRDPILMPTAIWECLLRPRKIDLWFVKTFQTEDGLYVVDHTSRISGRESAIG